MRILIYGINFVPELTGIGKYTGEMSEWLVQHGHEIRVVTAPPYYPSWEIDAAYSSRWYVTEIINGASTTRCPLWVPKTPRTVTRILHLLSFNLSSLPVLVRQLVWRPDVVFCVAPSFLAAPQVLPFKWLVKTKIWLHFQDFEICAMFGSGLLNGGKKLSQFAHFCQRVITRRFDRVSSISNRMCDSADQKNVSGHPVVLFPNWVDTDFISPAGNGGHFRKLWGFGSKDKIILYSGNLGKKQGLELIIAAADRLQTQPDMRFVIIGDGASKSELVEMVRERKLNNVTFFPLQSYEQFSDLLAFGDIHLVVQKKDAADTVLPSKLTGILAAGRHSILTAEPETELGVLVEKHPGIATLVPPEDCNALVEAILDLSSLIDSNRGAHNQVARDYAVNDLGREKVLERFEQSLIALVGQ